MRDVRGMRWERDIGEMTEREREREGGGEKKGEKDRRSEETEREKYSEQGEQKINEGKRERRE
eukprot:1392300-Amorphochlora_amoeboformis.AAC.1